MERVKCCFSLSNNSPLSGFDIFLCANEKYITQIGNKEPLYRTHYF